MEYMETCREIEKVYIVCICGESFCFHPHAQTDEGGDFLLWRMGKSQPLVPNYTHSKSCGTPREEKYVYGPGAQRANTTITTIAAAGEGVRVLLRTQFYSELCNLLLGLAKKGTKNREKGV